MVCAKRLFFSVALLDVVGPLRGHWECGMGGSKTVREVTCAVRPVIGFQCLAPESLSDIELLICGPSENHSCSSLCPSVAWATLALSSASTTHSESDRFAHLRQSRDTVSPLAKALGSSLVPLLLPGLFSTQQPREPLKM
jgi:hypothetical protein